MAAERHTGEGNTIAVPCPARSDNVFRTTEVARVLGTSPMRVRSIVRAGLCRPARRGGAFEFSFQDLVLLRTAHGLLQAQVPPRRVRHALGALAEQLPAHRPLSGVRIYADSRQVLVRDGGTAWHPDSGQVVFTFDVDELARTAGAVVRVAAKTRRRAPVRRPAPTQDAGLWFERGLGRERRNDLDGACEAYRRALDLDPHMSDAYVNLGRLVHQNGDAAEAARLYHLALESAPDDVVAHYNLGVALEDQRHRAAAVLHYRCALQIDHTFADAHFNLARLLEQLGQPAEALRHLLTYRKLTHRS